MILCFLGVLKEGDVFCLPPTTDDPLTRDDFYHRRKTLGINGLNDLTYALQSTSLCVISAHEEVEARTGAGEQTITTIIRH